MVLLGPDHGCSWWDIFPFGVMGGCLKWLEPSICAFMLTCNCL
uniref:Uncharacterized protein n=1 Tax=Rhizophora mucronata TaxID=61149 RepID=A0A2P2IQL1_RHIMU